VWTGEQALANGLIDQTGDLRDAIAKAREFARLPDDVPVALVAGKGKPFPPPLPAAEFGYLLDNMRALANGTAQAILPIHWR
jgi:ClpP class serine protease